MRMPVTLFTPRPLFQSRNIQELMQAFNEDDDGPDGGTFNRPTQVRRAGPRPELSLTND